MRFKGSFFASLMLVAAPLGFTGQARAQSEDEIRRAVVEQSIANYPGACPCPYSLQRNGQPCGNRSGYDRPSSNASRSPDVLRAESLLRLKCFPSDVTSADITLFRAARAPNTFDHDRPPPGRSYFADDFFRRPTGNDSERRLLADDRIYRGRDAHFYCRRPDGTTGAVTGAGMSSVRLANGQSGLILLVLSDAAGRPIDANSSQGELRCR